MQDALVVRQANIDSVNKTYMSLQEQCDASYPSLPQGLQEKMYRLNSEWARVLYLASNLRPTSDSSVEEVFLGEGREIYYLIYYYFLSIPIYDYAVLDIKDLSCLSKEKFP